MPLACLNIHEWIPFNNSNTLRSQGREDPRVGTISLASRTPNEDLTLKVEVTIYSTGTLVLSDSSTPNMSSLVFVDKDSTSRSGALGTSTRSSRAFREIVSSLHVEGWMLFLAIVLPLPETAAIVNHCIQKLNFMDLKAQGSPAKRQLENFGLEVIFPPNIYFQDKKLLFSLLWE